MKYTATLLALIGGARGTPDVTKTIEVPDSVTKFTFSSQAFCEAAIVSFIGTTSSTEGVVDISTYEVNEPSCQRGFDFLGAPVVANPPVKYYDFSTQGTSLTVKQYLNADCLVEASIAKVYDMSGVTCASTGEASGSFAYFEPSTFESKAIVARIFTDSQCTNKQVTNSIQLIHAVAQNAGNSLLCDSVRSSGYGINSFGGPTVVQAPKFTGGSTKAQIVEASTISLRIYPGAYTASSTDPTNACGSDPAFVFGQLTSKTCTKLTGTSAASICYPSSQGCYVYVYPVGYFAEKGISLNQVAALLIFCCLVPLLAICGCCLSCVVLPASVIACVCCACAKKKSSASVGVAAPAQPMMVVAVQAQPMEAVIVAATVESTPAVVVAATVVA